MNIVLMYGGRSGEHEISLISCASVARAISKEHNVTLISVSKDGKWYLEDDSVFTSLKASPTAKLEVHQNEQNRVFTVPGGGTKGAFFAKGKLIECDVVFPVMHGTYSEDGTIQGLFEMCGIPYVGCRVLSSAATMEKDITKTLLKEAGIPVVPGVCLTRADINDSKKYDSLIQSAIDTLGFPLFVKPCSAGSSDGASKAENRRELNFALMEAFTWDNKVLIEKAVNAREIECSVTGNSITENPQDECTVLKAYGPGEIVPKHTFYDYDAKYNDPDGAELKIPALLDSELLNKIKELAIKAYRAVNASGLSRVDFFIDKDTNELFLNEINSLPGFTSISMFPKMCASEGRSFTDLIDCILKEAVCEFSERQKLCTSR